MSSQPHWRTHIFQDGCCTTNQYCLVELKGKIFGLPCFFLWGAGEQVTREPHGKVSVENPQEPNMDLFIFQDSHYSDPSHDQTPVRWWEFGWEDLQLPELIWFGKILGLFVDFLHFPVNHGLPPRSPTKPLAATQSSRPTWSPSTVVSPLARRQQLGRQRLDYFNCWPKRSGWGREEAGNWENRLVFHGKSIEWKWRFNGKLSIHS